MHTTPLTPPARQGVLLPMIFIGLMFFILGFVTWLNGSLIPFLKIVCALNNFQALWVAFAFYIAYTVMALPSAALLARIGYKKGMTAALGVMAAGALAFIPAARSGQYAIFLAALFTLASGMTLMQTAINPYIVCIGARESAAMRISIMGLFNKGAGIVVPLVFSALILSGMERFSEPALAALDVAGREALRNELSQRLVLPYAVMAAGLLAFMALIHFSSLREPDLDENDAPSASTSDAPSEAPFEAAFEAPPDRARRWGVFQHPQVVLGAIALFGYVGVEVIAGDTIGLYGRELGVTHYGVLTSYTMGFMVLGYLLGVALIPKWMSQRTALILSGAGGLLFVLGVALSSPTASGISQALLGWAGVPPVPDTVFFLALLGLSNALVWPSIWPLALEGLGRYTAAGSALLIMGIAGGALIPMLYGHLADVTSPQLGYWVMLPWYGLILLYALFGSRLRRW